MVLEHYPVLIIVILREAVLHHRQKCLAAGRVVRWNEEGAAEL
jgi:hypothetical protein